MLRNEIIAKSRKTQTKVLRGVNGVLSHTNLFIQAVVLDAKSFFVPAFP